MNLFPRGDVARSLVRGSSDRSLLFSQHFSYSVLFPPAHISGFRAFFTILVALPRYAARRRGGEELCLDIEPSSRNATHSSYRTTITSQVQL